MNNYLLFGFIIVLILVLFYNKYRNRIPKLNNIMSTSDIKNNNIISKNFSVDSTNKLILSFFSAYNSKSSCAMQLTTNMST